MKVFDMGKNPEGPLAASLRCITQGPDVKAYIEGSVAQFTRDLLGTGRAVMPDGEVVDLTPTPHPYYPECPLSALTTNSDKG